MANQHSIEFLDKMRVLAPLLRNHPPLSTLSFSALCDWVSWYWNRGTLCYVLNQDGGASAVCLVKVFRHLRQFLDPFVHDPCGNFCMIELMCAEEPVAMGAIFTELQRRFGPQGIIMWDRGARTEGGPPRMYRWHQFRKLARRLTYGVTESKYGISKNA